MKKSQVLAALALAFALGVVAPVMSTANTVSALTIADGEKGIDGVATKADVENAIASIKANQAYKNMVNVHDQLEKLSKTPGVVLNYDYADFAVTSDGITTGAFYDVQQALNTIIPYYYSGSTSNDYVEQINEAVTKAVDFGRDNGYRQSIYEVMADIFSAIEAYNVSSTDAQRDAANAAFRNAVHNYNIRFDENFVSPAADFNYDSEVKVPTYVHGTTNDIETHFNSVMPKATDNTKYTYGNMLKLFNAVEYAKENRDKYVAGYNAITAAFKAPGVLSIPKGQSTYNYIIENKINAAGTATDHNVSLNYLANMIKDSSYFNLYGEWMDVRNAVMNAEGSMTNGNDKYNYNLVMQMARALKTAENNNMQTPEQIAQTLVNGVQTQNPGQNVTTIWNADKTVSVTGVLAEGTQVIANASDKKVAAFGDSKYSMSDIYLVDAAGKKIQPNGSVTVTMKVPAGLDGTKSSIYYVDDNGKVEKMVARFENGNMVFTTNHFSLYAIVEDNGNNYGITTPSAGVVSSTDGSASTTVAMVAGVATALTAAGAGVVAYRNARRSTRK